MKFDGVLFDCDGVLVDSEPITNGVLRDMLEELGWQLSREECMRIFVGKAVRDEVMLIEQHTVAHVIGPPHAISYLRAVVEHEAQPAFGIFGRHHAAVSRLELGSLQRTLCRAAAEFFVFVCMFCK